MSGKRIERPRLPAGPASSVRAGRLNVVYLAARSPVISETFIVRELEALGRSDSFDLEIRSLFPSPDSAVHDISRR